MKKELLIIIHLIKLKRHTCLEDNNFNKYDRFHEFGNLNYSLSNNPIKLRFIFLYESSLKQLF